MVTHILFPQFLTLLLLDSTKYRGIDTGTAHEITRRKILVFRMLKSSLSLLVFLHILFKAIANRFEQLAGVWERHFYYCTPGRNDFYFYIVARVKIPLQYMCAQLIDVAFNFRASLDNINLANVSNTHAHKASSPINNFISVSHYCWKKVPQISAAVLTNNVCLFVF